MTEPLVPLPLPDLTVIVQPVAVVLAAYGAAKFGPPLVRTARQRAYDEASITEAVRLLVSAPAGPAPDPDFAVALVRAFHPRQHPGLSGWRARAPPPERTSATFGLLRSRYGKNFPAIS